MEDTEDLHKTLGTNDVTEAGTVRGSLFCRGLDGSRCWGSSGGLKNLLWGAGTMAGPFLLSV